MIFSQYLAQRHKKENRNGISNVVKVRDCDCTEIFLEILRIFIQAISINTHKNLIHSGVRLYLHRMIICLDNEILEYIPMILENFLKASNEPKDLTDLMPLINQVLTKYKQQIMPFMQTILIQLTNIVFNYVNSLPSEVISDILKVNAHQIQSMNLSIPLPVSSNLAESQMNGDSEISPDTQYVLDIQFLYKSYFQFLHNISNNDLM